MRPKVGDKWVSGAASSVRLTPGGIMLMMDEPLPILDEFIPGMPPKLRTWYEPIEDEL